MNKLQIVQFIHPGGEHIVQDDKVKPWNTGNHRRKFMEVDGRYFENGVEVNGNIHFWGEWEPESRVVKRIENPVQDGPSNIHQPFWISPSAYDGDVRLQNTDPFVFGDCFHYSICQQHTKVGPTLLRHLDRGSVILFGSCRSTDHFVIDTVFVVRDWIEYERKEFLEKVAPRIHPTYTAVTFSSYWGRDFLGGDMSGANDEAPSQSFRVYIGATVADKVDGMFSFFPCQTSSLSPDGFRRPTIEIDGVINGKLLQSKKGTQFRSTEEVGAYWDEVVSQVHRQGLKLGTSAHMPDHRTLA